MRTPRRWTRKTRLQTSRVGTCPWSTTSPHFSTANSLGRPLASARDRLRNTIELDWAQGLIRSWPEKWLSMPLSVGDGIAASALGAGAGQVVVTDSTSVLLFKALQAGADLRLGRTEIVVDTGNFPTGRYIAQALLTSAPSLLDMEGRVTT